jgi:hypothetical protein
VVDRIVHVEHGGRGVGRPLAVVQGHAAVRSIDHQAKHRAAPVARPLHVDKLDAEMVKGRAQEGGDAGNVVAVHM